jgi:hypothetical protein
MCKRILGKVFFGFFLLNLSVYTLVAQEDKKPGGGWSVEHYVDEFGDPTNETYWRTSPKNGAMVDHLIGGFSQGKVGIYVDAESMWLRFYTKYGDIRGWILFDDGRGWCQLSIKDTVTGNVIYSGSCNAVTRGGDKSNADITFRLSNDLLNALRSKHILKFVCIEVDTGRTLGSFSMTGELPY